MKEEHVILRLILWFLIYIHCFFVCYSVPCIDFCFGEEQDNGVGCVISRDQSFEKRLRSLLMSLFFEQSRKTLRVCPKTKLMAITGA